MFRSSGWKAAAAVFAACAGSYGALGRAEAGSLCPPVVTQAASTPTQVCVAYDISLGCTAYVTQYTPTTATFSGFQLRNGECTNNGGAPTQNGSAVDPAAFSGAALASQALSELSQSSSQETARSAENSIANRREQEEQRCAEGFSRVNGECERNAPAVAAAAPEPTPAPEPERPRKKSKKAVAAAAAEEPAPARKARHKAAAAAEEVEAPAPKAKRKAAARREEAPPPQVAYAPRAPVVKGYDMPPPIEAPFRYGSWAQVYGEYEKRDATGQTSVNGPDFNGGAPVPLTSFVQSRSGTVGFQAGADITTRGLIVGNDGVIAGVLAGYLSNNLTLNTTNTSAIPSVVGNSSSVLYAHLSGPTVGVYATYFSGGFSTDLLAKFDFLTLNQNFNESLAFGGPFGPFSTNYSGSGSTSVVDSTVAANLNYRFDLQPNYFIQPTVGAQFTALSYGGGAAALGLEDGQQVMIQGGAKVGVTTPFSNNILLTSTLTGLAYDDVVVNGGFIPGASFNGNNILASADRGHVRGRGILAFNFDYGNGFTSFVQGDVHGGTGLFGAGGKAGLRYQW